MKIKLYQHLYTYLEAHESLVGKGGFQTVFASRDFLTQDDILNLERIIPIPFIRPRRKWVYTRLSEDKYIFSYVTFLREKDSMGRGGKLVVHTYIAPSDEFSKLGYNPFMIFDHVRFHTTITSVLAAGDKETLNIEPFILHIPDAKESDHGYIYKVLPHEDVWKKLLEFAMWIDELEEDRVSLAVTGSERSILDFLRKFYDLLPPTIRKKAFFDTFLDDSTMTSQYFWIKGHSHSDATWKKSYVFSIAGMKFKTGRDFYAKTPVQLWYSHVKNKYPVIDLTRFLPHAFSLDEWFRGNVLSKNIWAGIPQNVYQDFLYANQALIPDFVDRLLENCAGPELRKRVFQRCYHKLKRTSPSNIPTFLEKIDKEFKSWLEAEYRQQFEPPPQSEMRELEEYIRGHISPFLTALLFIWQKNWGDFEMYFREITEKNERVLRDILAWAFTYFDIRIKIRAECTETNASFRFEFFPAREGSDAFQFMGALFRAFDIEDHDIKIAGAQIRTQKKGKRTSWLSIFFPQKDKTPENYEKIEYQCIDDEGLQTFLSFVLKIGGYVEKSSKKR